ncbi:MAG: hypothetical protein ACI8XM_000600 [Haloarculaceae archaeon]|jgi:hypothetical protein
MTDDWRDQLAGARMQVDQQFQSKVEQSQFNSQEWGLIMTAVKFDVEQPDSPEQARLVANTTKVAQIIPELERIQTEMGGQMQEGGSSGGGIVDKFKQYFSSSDSGANKAEQKAAATSLAEEYATDLQTYLEKRDRWDEIRQAAAEQQ